MRCLLLLLLLPALWAEAVIESYEFADEEQRRRYQQFTEELRCPKCQNQNLAGSDSPIAMDLRRELHRLLQEGRSDQEVVEFMVSRYGDFILYRPAFKAETAILWLAPALFLFIGALVLVLIVRRQRMTAGAKEQLDDDEDTRLKNLLARETDDD